MIVYKVLFGNTEYEGESHEFNVIADSIVKAEEVAISLYKKDKENPKKGRWTRSVEFVVETDN